MTGGVPFYLLLLSFWDSDSIIKGRDRWQKILKWKGSLVPIWTGRKLIVMVIRYSPSEVRTDQIVFTIVRSFVMFNHLDPTITIVTLIY